MSLLMTGKTARVQKYITVRKIKGESTKKGKYEKYFNLQKFPCPAVIKTARTGVLSLPSMPCNGTSLPLISSFKNYILIKFFPGTSECNFYYLAMNAAIKADLVFCMFLTNSKFS